MSRSDFVAHQGLSGVAQSDIQLAIQAAEARAHRGHFVAAALAGTLRVIPEMSANRRQDIAKVHYDTEGGYVFNVA